VLDMAKTRETSEPVSERSRAGPGKIPGFFGLGQQTFIPQMYAYGRAFAGAGYARKKPPRL
jgi:hypothetical protein